MEYSLSAPALLALPSTLLARTDRGMRVGLALVDCGVLGLPDAVCGRDLDGLLRRGLVPERITPGRYFGCANSQIRGEAARGVRALAGLAGLLLLFGSSSFFLRHGLLFR